MATTVYLFVNRCYDIVRAKPEYELGSSSKSKCDCIGMIKYGLRVNGVTLSTTGTNWTFRNQVTNIRKITSASVLQVGDVVFKAKAPGDSGYNLKKKYLKGGDAYNGDLNDYCHIGVVASVRPLKIIHMTSPTAKEDTSIGKWKYAAQLLSKYISDYSKNNVQTPAEPEPEPVNTDPVSTNDPCEATVYAPTGQWVKMRQRPTTKCAQWDNIPVGAKVTVVVQGYEWTKINYGRRKGWYMMTKFLTFG